MAHMILAGAHMDSSGRAPCSSGRVGPSDDAAALSLSAAELLPLLAVCMYMYIAHPEVDRLWGI